MGVRVRVGLRDSVGVQSGQKNSFRHLWCPWSIKRLWHPWTPGTGTFGNYLMAGGPLGGGGGVAQGLGIRLFAIGGTYCLGCTTRTCTAVNPKIGVAVKN